MAQRIGGKYGKRHGKNSVEREAFIEAAMDGFMNAMGNFDKEKNTEIRGRISFMSYAQQHIRGAIKDYLRDNARASYSRHVSKKALDAVKEYETGMKLRGNNQASSLSEVVNTKYQGEKEKVRNAILNSASNQGKQKIFGLDMDTLTTDMTNASPRSQAELLQNRDLLKQISAIPLDSKDRRIFEKVILGQSQTSVAQDMNLSISTINHRFHRARKVIMRHLGHPLSEEKKQRSRPYKNKYTFSQEFIESARTALLDPKDYQVIESVMQGKSHSSIAQIHGVTRSMISRRFRRACKIVWNEVHSEQQEESYDIGRFKFNIRQSKFRNEFRPPLKTPYFEGEILSGCCWCRF